jgi:hypothetical protein
MHVINQKHHASAVSKIKGSLPCTCIRKQSYGNKKMSVQLGAISSREYWVQILGRQIDHLGCHSSFSVPPSKYWYFISNQVTATSFRVLIPYSLSILSYDAVQSESPTVTL